MFPAIGPLRVLPPDVELMLIKLLKSDYTDARGWRAKIVNLPMTDNPPVNYREPQAIIPLEVKEGPDDAAAGGDEPGPDVDSRKVAVKNCLLKLLNPATVFEYIKEYLSRKAVLKLYGQCVATYPMINCERFETHFHPLPRISPSSREE